MRWNNALGAQQLGIRCWWMCASTTATHRFTQAVVKTNLARMATRDKVRIGEERLWKECGRERPGTNSMARLVAVAISAIVPGWPAFNQTYDVQQNALPAPPNCSGKASSETSGWLSATKSRRSPESLGPIEQLRMGQRRKAA